MLKNKAFTFNVKTSIFFYFELESRIKFSQKVTTKRSKGSGQYERRRGKGGERGVKQNMMRRCKFDVFGIID